MLFRNVKLYNYIYIHTYCYIIIFISYYLHTKLFASFSLVILTQDQELKTFK
jgi:hypothetical protein